MKQLKAIAKKIPGVRLLYYRCVGLALKLRSPDSIFTDIFAGNKWGGKDSVSGLGSDLDQTRVVIGELPVVCGDFGIQTILDIPCGDFYWMKNVNFSHIDYVGADIVSDLIQKNIHAYEKENVHFRKLDLMKDKLPKVDLIFCRDCLVHFSNKDIFLALRNICESESTYLLTTTFASRHKNSDIATGQWRALNLEIAPIMLPPPLRTINEQCTEGSGAYKDKSLGLWRVTDIKVCLERAGKSI